MKLFSLRSGFYLALLLVFIAAIEFKKSQITEKKKESVVSVLGILMKDGAPVEVKTIRTTSIEDTAKVTLLKCGNNTACFYKSRAMASRIRPGMKVLRSQDNMVIGQVKQVSSQANYRNGLYRTVVLMNNLSQIFKNENTLVAEVVLNKKSNVFVVPIEVVERKLEKQFIWIAKDGKSQRIEVETGIQNNREVEIKKGLSGDEKVIVKGLSQAREYSNRVNLIDVDAHDPEPVKTNKVQENI